MGNRGQLQTEHFEELIRRNGEPLVRYLLRVGPCPNTHRGVLRGFRPNPNCAVCGGVGEVFEELDLAGIAGKSPAGGLVLALNAVESKRRQPLEKVTDQMQLSYLPQDYPMGDGDRLLFRTRDGWASDSFVYEGGTGTVNLRYWPVLEIASAYRATGKITSGFAVSGDGRGVTFAAGAGLASGEQVTVLFRYREQWQVTAKSHTLRIAATNGDFFPYRCLAAKWQGYPTDTTAENA